MLYIASEFGYLVAVKLLFPVSFAEHFFVHAEMKLCDHILSKVSSACYVACLSLSNPPAVNCAYLHIGWCNLLCLLCHT